MTDSIKFKPIGEDGERNEPRIPSVFERISRNNSLKLNKYYTV